VNSLGVKMFADSTLYTALKNAVVGIALLVPLAVSGEKRARYARLTPPQWLLLDDFQHGDTVSIHWDWACDRIDGQALGQLVRATRRAIAHTNLTL